jgi:hypothetical protein
MKKKGPADLRDGQPGPRTVKKRTVPETGSVFAVWAVLPKVHGTVSSPERIHAARLQGREAVVLVNPG